MAARSLTRPLHRGLLVAVIPVLAACAGAPSKDNSASVGNLLRDSLPVAAAALAAGQLDAARRLYTSLADRFPEAPEPALGLGYIALYDGNFESAQKNFLEAAALAEENQELRAEALLGAGRAALARGLALDAQGIFEDALAAARDTRSAPWIRNGLAVAAALDGDYAAAESHFAEALRLSPSNPRITANYVRTLLGAGRIDDAARVFAAQPTSFWRDEDGPTLARLVEESRVQAAFARRPAAQSAPAAQSVPSSPDRPRPETPGVATPTPRPPPPVSLALQLSDFSLSPSGPGPAPPAAPADPSALVLRVADWPAPISPPALNGRHPLAPSAAQPHPAAPGPSDSLPSPVAGDLGPAATDEPALELPERPPPATMTLVVGQSRQLHFDREATAVSVASPEIADVQLLSPSVLYVIGKDVGRTSIAVLVDESWNEELLVTVELDLAPVRESLAAEPALVGVQVRPVARGIALAGEVGSAEEADRAMRIAAAALTEGTTIVNDLRIAGLQQVNLEVQIAEVNRSVTENLGVNWEAFRSRGDHRFGFRIGREIYGQGDGNMLNTNLLQGTVFDGAPSPSLYAGRITGRTRIGVVVDALTTAGLANVLARPNVTAVSGESASFFSGGEFPLPAGLEPGGAIVFEYKKYGVLLDFVPTVVDAGRIVLTVRPEVSEPSRSQSLTVASGISVPVINVRRAETTVEVADGESIVIAGLFRNASNTTESGVTGLKDVPLLGALFGHTSNRADELELIVIVTARLVRPNAAPVPGGTEVTAASRQAGGYHY